jgi:hypothetical protein
MLACEKFNDASSQQKETRKGLVVLLVSSLLHGAAFSRDPRSRRPTQRKQRLWRAQLRQTAKRLA